MFPILFQLGVNLRVTSSGAQLLLNQEGYQVGLDIDWKCIMSNEILVYMAQVHINHMYFVTESYELNSLAQISSPRITKMLLQG